jgi:ABC-type multidrug transport system fused ATPase/permease subunit
MILKPFAILGPSLRHHRRYLAIALAATLGAQLIGIPFPLLTRSMIHIVASAQKNHSETSWTDPEQALWIFAGILGGLVLLRCLLGWQQRLQGERLGQGVLADLRGEMYTHLQSLSQGYFDRRPSGRILIRFVGDANTLRTWLAKTVIAVPADVLTIIAVAMAVSVVNVQLLIAAGIPLLAVIPALVLINPRARTLTRAVRTSQSQLCGVLNERLASIGLVKSAGIQNADRSHVQGLIDLVATVKVKRAKLDAWAQAISVGAATAALAAVGVWGARLYLFEQITQADLLAAVWLTVLFRGPVNRLASANVVHQRARVAVERIGALLAKPGEPGRSPELPAYAGPGRSVELRRLGYRGSDGRWLFRRLDAVMNGPALVSLTDDAGHVGTTLLELLERLRRPHKGRIRLDGQDVRKLNVDSIRRAVGWVDRDRRVVNVLGFVDGDNGNEWATIEQRLEAAWPRTQAIAPDGDLSLCVKALRSLGHRRWTESRVARNVQLRFAICCALLDDPPILLLDDPTRDLDPTSVRQLIDWLQETAGSRLVIAATNDPRLIAASGQVVHVAAVARKPRASGSSRKPASTPVSRGVDAGRETTAGPTAAPAAQLSA